MSMPIEMRRQLRYRLIAQAIFEWEGVAHERVQGEGTTRDLSVLGAFVRTATCPPVHTAIHIEITLPFLPGMKSPIRLGGEARVVRVDHPSEGPGENGFAVVQDGSNQWNLLSDQDRSNAVAFAELCLAGNAETK